MKPSTSFVLPLLLLACQRPTVQAALVNGSAPRVVVEEPAAQSPPLRRLVEPVSTGYLVRDRKLVDVAVHCELDDGGSWSCTWTSEPAVRFPGTWTELASGDSFVCALDRTGHVSCIQTRTITRSAEPLALPFRVRRIAGNEGGLVLEAQDGRVHECALETGSDKPIRECAKLTEVDVPDADAYVNAGRFTCSLDRSRSPSCRGMASENSDAEESIAVPDFPQQVRRLVEGLGFYETGAVVCAIGMSGELACFRLLRRDAAGKLIAEVHKIDLPGAVRDLAIGRSYGRVVLEDGRVYAIPMSITSTPWPKVPLFEAAPVAIPEPADTVGSGSCIRYRSGHITCETPRKLGAR